MSHPTLERKEEELLVEFEEFERDLQVNEILKEVDEEFQFPKDSSVDEFAGQLKQEKQDQPLWAVHIQPQFTCPWFIEGLNFVALGWRNEFQRPRTPPPPAQNEEELKQRVEKERTCRKRHRDSYRAKHPEKVRESNKRYRERNRERIRGQRKQYGEKIEKESGRMFSPKGMERNNESEDVCRFVDITKLIESKYVWLNVNITKRIESPLRSNERNGKRTIEKRLVSL